MGAHPIKTSLLLLKIMESISMILLLITGVVLLAQLTGLKIYNKDKVQCRCYLSFLEAIFENSKIYWPCFIGSMSIMVIEHSIALFTS